MHLNDSISTECSYYGLFQFHGAESFVYFGIFDLALEPYIHV